MLEAIMKILSSFKSRFFSTDPETAKETNDELKNHQGIKIFSVISLTPSMLEKLPDKKNSYQKTFKSYSQEEIFALYEKWYSTYITDSWRMRIMPNQEITYQEHFQKFPKATADNLEFRSQLEKDLRKDGIDPLLAKAIAILPTQNGIIRFGLDAMRNFILLTLAGLETDGYPIFKCEAINKKSYHVEASSKLVIIENTGEDKQEKSIVTAKPCLLIKDSYRIDLSEEKDGKIIQPFFIHSQLFFLQSTPKHIRDTILYGLHFIEHNEERKAIQKLICDEKNFYFINEWLLSNELHKQEKDILEAYYEHNIEAYYQPLFLAKLSPFAQESSTFDFCMIFAEATILKKLPPGTFKITRNQTTYLLDATINFVNLDNSQQQDLLNIIKNHHYTILTILNCLQLDDNIFTEILKNNPNIKLLTIRNCPNLTGNAFNNLTLFCSVIEKFMLQQLSINHLLIPNNKSLLELEITDCDLLTDVTIKKHDLNTIKIKNCNNIATINLPDSCQLIDFSELTNFSEEQFFNALKNRSYRTLKLSESIVDKAIKEKIPLTEWHYCSNLIEQLNEIFDIKKTDSSTYAIKLLKPLPNLDKLTLALLIYPVISLDLSNCQLSDNEIKILCANLINNNTLNELNLSNNIISDVGAKKIATSLNDKLRINIINLSKNNITDIGALTLVELISFKKLNVKIDLSDNPILDSFSDKLATILNENKYLLEVVDGAINIYSHSRAKKKLALNLNNHSLVNTLFADSKKLHDTVRQIKTEDYKKDIRTMRDCLIYQHENGANKPDKGHFLLSTVSGSELNTALHWAVQNQHTQAVVFLMSQMQVRNMRLDSLNSNGKSPFDLAKEVENTTIIEMLIAFDTNTDWETKKEVSELLKSKPLQALGTWKNILPSPPAENNSETTNVKLTV
jgi:hypothetical protein